jgi:hypothetical protein
MSPEFAPPQRSPNVREADLEHLELPADDAATTRGVILGVALRA